MIAMFYVSLVEMSTVLQMSLVLSQLESMLLSQMKDNVSKITRIYIF